MSSLPADVATAAAASRVKVPGKTASRGQTAFSPALKVA